jgi:hypothetical protein
MLHRFKELRGKKIRAADGEIGHVKDLYFDDGTWAVRYLVVSTGSWLAERLVLLSPHALGPLSEEELQVNLTRRQIEHCPPIDAHQPVSRRYEIAYYNYYGWPAYWDEGGVLGGIGGFSAMPPPVASANVRAADAASESADHHLQSANAIIGYAIEASDGGIGHVSDFSITVPGWGIRQLIAATGHWFSSRELPIPSDKIDRISCEDSKVFVHLTQAAILAASDSAEPAQTAERN